MYNWLHRNWYEGGSSYWLLLPLTGLFWILVLLRRWLYRIGVLGSKQAVAPVIVIGNITTGGTGKTPLTIWLVQQLQAHGYSPGVVSRGYGGERSQTSMRVDSASDPAEVGDEPVLIAQRAACPVVVDQDRCRAAEMLVADGADVVIADDGLQHYRLARSYEICVVDGARGLGNGHLLPAGPLREPASRLNQVDQVLLNGSLQKADPVLSAVKQQAIEFSLQPAKALRLNGTAEKEIGDFAGTTVHGVAAIGNPQRFFDLLRAHGMQVIEHAFPDHAALSSEQLRFGDDFDVLMTEKDAVKLGDSLPDKYWSLPVELSIDSQRAESWMAELVARLKTEEGTR